MMPFGCVLLMMVVDEIHAFEDDIMSSFERAVSTTGVSIIRRGRQQTIILSGRPGSNGNEKLESS